MKSAANMVVLASRVGVKVHSCHLITDMSAFQNSIYLQIHVIIEVEFVKTLDNQRRKYRLRVYIRIS